jgi:antitoxin HicB
MKTRFEDYSVAVRPLTPAEGGGFLAAFPDLPGCMADGETPEEAIADARGAFDCWIAAHVADGRPVPVPGAANASPVRVMQRVPGSLDAAQRNPGLGCAATPGFGIAPPGLRCWVLHHPGFRYRSTRATAGCSEAESRAAP